MGAIGVVHAGAFRGLALGLIWWVLTEGDASGFAWGVVIVAIATVASLRLAPPSGAHVRPLAAIRYAGVFLAGSALGGADVASRALSPSLPIDPELLRHRLRTPPGPARTLFLATMNLMPGSLTVSITGDEAAIHVLRDSPRTRARIAALERRAAAVFGAALGDPDG